MVSVRHPRMMGHDVEVMDWANWEDDPTYIATAVCRACGGVWHVRLNGRMKWEPCNKQAADACKEVRHANEG